MLGQIGKELTQMMKNTERQKKLQIDIEKLAGQGKDISKQLKELEKIMKAQSDLTKTVMKNVK